jgi:hypothetical protein
MVAHELPAFRVSPRLLQLLLQLLDSGGGTITHANVFASIWERVAF